MEPGGNGRSWRSSAATQSLWNLEKRAQAAAFAAARPGVACEDIDAAARKVITDAGYGPGYQVPGLPHRTGHGIGLDSHEWTYLVKGNKTLLPAGMCFSNEPTISNYAEFGARLEDCFHVTETTHGRLEFPESSRFLFVAFVMNFVFVR